MAEGRLSHHYAHHCFLSACPLTSLPVSAMVCVTDSSRPNPGRRNRSDFRKIAERKNGTFPRFVTSCVVQVLEQSALGRRDLVVRFLEVCHG